MGDFRELQSRMRVMAIMKTNQLRRWWSSWSKYGFDRVRRARQLALACFITITLLGLIVAQEILHSRIVLGTAPLPPRQSSSILKSALINPAVDIEREKIRNLLESSDFGRLTIRETLLWRGSRRSRKKERRGRAWMIPLATKLYEPYLKQFFGLAKTWVGQDRPEELNPAVIVQDILRAVKEPLDRNTEHWARAKQSDETRLQFRAATQSNSDRSGNSSIGSAIRQSGPTQKYRTCAVVGNSGILLNGTRGEEIDSHEFVIRLNNAEVFPYTKHVGSKTGLSFLNSNVFLSCAANAGCWCHPFGKEVPVAMYICQATHLMHAAMCGGQHETPLLITHSLLDALCAAIVKWYSLTSFVQTTGKHFREWHKIHDEEYFHYSSGMQAVVLAMGICDRVDLYGFGKFPGAKHHYHTNQKREQKLHDFAAEYVFYEDLVHGKRRAPFLQDVTFPPVRIFY